MSSSGSISLSWLHWSAWTLQGFLLLLEWGPKPSPQTTEQCMVQPCPLASAWGCRKLQSFGIPFYPQRNQLLPSQCGHALRVLAHTAPTCDCPQWPSSCSWSCLPLPDSACLPLTYFASSSPYVLLWPASGVLSFLLYSMWLSHNIEDIRLCGKHRCGQKPDSVPGFITSQGVCHTTALSLSFLICKLVLSILIKWVSERICWESGHGDMVGFQ